MHAYLEHLPTLSRVLRSLGPASISSGFLPRLPLALLLPTREGQGVLGKAQKQTVQSRSELSEREFYGDRLLGFAVAHALRQNYPSLSFSVKHRIYEAMVRNDTLNFIAPVYGLSNADAFERALASIESSSSVLEAIEWTHRVFRPLVNAALTDLVPGSTVPTSQAILSITRHSFKPAARSYFTASFLASVFESTPSPSPTSLPPTMISSPVSPLSSTSLKSQSKSKSKPSLAAHQPSPPIGFSAVHNWKSHKGSSGRTFLLAIFPAPKQLWVGELTLLVVASPLSSAPSTSPAFAVKHLKIGPFEGKTKKQVKLLLARAAHLKVDLRK